MNYVAKTPNGKVFDNSLAKNAPYYIRVGSGAVIPVQQGPTICFLAPLQEAFVASPRALS